MGLSNFFWNSNVMAPCVQIVKQHELFFGEKYVRSESEHLSPGKFGEVFQLSVSNATKQYPSDYARFRKQCIRLQLRTQRYPGATFPMWTQQ